MKRSGPIQRKTPMPSGNQLARTAKPAKRKTDGPAESTLERNAKGAMKKRSGGDCEIRTPWHIGPATNASHRQAEGQGGPWAAWNLLDSCGSGTTGCHGYLHAHPEEAREHGWFVSAFNRKPWDVPVWIWYRGVRAMYLLDDKGGAALAPFPESDPRHPDDIDHVA